MPDTHAPVHAALPLALLEAMQGVDAPVRDDLDEYHEELVVKRLGTSRTVAAQIERYEKLVRDGVRTPADELIALLRLVARRGDAGLVFSDAGRRAGLRAVRALSPAVRTTHAALPGGLQNGFGFRVARQRAERVLGARLDRVDDVARAQMPRAPSADVSEAACAFYGAALAEMLRQLTDFDGAMLHVRCRARGDEQCVWRAAGEEPR